MEFVCFVWISEQTANFALQNIKRLVFITEVESVYCAVRTESLYNTQKIRLCCMVPKHGDSQKIIRHRSKLQKWMP